MLAIETKNLNKNIGSKVILSDINLQVQRGDFMGILGPNGSGKTTLLDIISSVTRPSSGEVIVLGRNLNINRAEATMNIGVMPQEPDLDSFDTCFNVAVAQTCLYGVSVQEAQNRVKKLFELVNLVKQSNMRPSQLSGGMKRRLMLAKALACEPQILILDEPTAGVDLIESEIIWRYIENLNKRGTTILLTTHVIDDLTKLCNSLTFLKDGKLQKSGSKDELRKEIDKVRYGLLLNDPIETVSKQLIPQYVNIIDSHNVVIELTKDIDMVSILSQLKSIGMKISRIKQVEELEIIIRKFM
jgi:ABC-2 type transport system ATP-binding protein